VYTAPVFEEGLKMSFQRMHLCCAICIATIAIPNAAMADHSGTATLTPGTFLNLDAGITSTAGGDVLWDGLALAPQGRAGVYNLGKYGSRVFKSIRAKNAPAAQYGATVIPASKLVPADIFGVHTNGGHYAKLIVTANEAGALSLQFTTFVAPGSVARVSTATAASSGPSITQLQNNYSYILPGQPNYGIAPGSLFVIVGTGLSADNPPVLQSTAPPGLQTTLNQTSVSVTVNGTTTTPALYYTSATQLAAVLPSSTPVGNGTVTVTYNGQTSPGATIRVVPSAVGLDTLYGTGNGLAVATDNNGNVFGFTNSAAPDQTITLWGSGIGGDPADDDRTYPQTQDNLTNVQTQVLIGGISANITYRGRSQYPGLDQYDVEIPNNVTPGCFVSVVVQTGSVVSNTVTLPVSPNGGQCSDPVTGLSGSQIQALASKPGGAVNVMAAVVSVGTGPGSSLALAATISTGYFGQGYGYVSEGSCVILPPEQGPLTNYIQAALDAGTIQVSGPTGQISLGSGPGLYQGHQANVPPGGNFTLSGSGGKDVGSFQVSLNVPAPTLTVTNQSALASVTRAQGATVTWSGGFPNGAIHLQGSAGAPAVKFFCYAPTSAGQLTIPPSILLAVPPGSGSISVVNVTAPQTISASGLDLGLAVGADNNGPKIDTTFN
jgi:uncharacterized protein (TIGR03437 family)